MRLFGPRRLRPGPAATSTRGYAPAAPPDVRPLTRPGNSGRGHCFRDPVSVPVSRAFRRSGAGADDGFGFDLDQHLRIDEAADLDHAGGRADGSEELTVHPADLLPAGDVGPVHAR